MAPTAIKIFTATRGFVPAPPEATISLPSLLTLTHIASARINVPHTQNKKLKKNMEYFKQPLTPAILEKEQPPRYCAMKQSSQSYPAVGSGRFCLQSFLVSACSFGAEIESKEIGSSLKKKKIYPVISVDKILTHTLKFPKRYLPASMIFFLVMAARALGQDIYDLFSKPAPSRVNRYQVKGV